MLVEAGGLAFLSGIACADGASLPARKGSHGQIERQTRANIAELKARLALARADLQRLAHITVYVDDINAFAKAAPLLERAFGNRRPALSVIEVPKPAPLHGARVQLTAIAWLGEGEPAAAG